MSTDLGQCVQADIGAYLTMQECNNVCIPLQSSHHPQRSMSGGAIFLLMYDVVFEKLHNDHAAPLTQPCLCFVYSFIFGFVTPYLIGGILYNKIVNNARGWELIPHVEFWTRNLPIYIGDGFRVVTCQTIQQREYYTSL